MRSFRPAALALAFTLTTGPDVSDRCEALAEELPNLRELSNIAGVSVAVADREGVSWSAAFGVRDQGTRAPVDEETVFEAASLSKPVFAYAVLQLVESGLIDLDTPLADYFPYADIAHDARHAKLTARMALTHTTGLPNWRPREGRLDFEYEPGERWRYSGEGFVMLQRVIEKLVGDSLQDIAQSLVFEPLGMTRSSYVWRERFANDVAHPHDELGIGRENRRMEDANAAYSLLTTATDYARFLAGVMRGDNLTDDTWAEMLRPQADVTTDVTWGLGWGLEEHADGAAFWHWGHNSGYRAFAIAYPARDFAFVYFSNSDNGMLLLRDLVRLATGEDDHPALLHLDYENHDAPGLVVRRTIESRVLELGPEDGIAAYFELKEEHPPELFEESLLDQVGSRLWSVHARHADAIEILRLNADEYPRSARAQANLGIALVGEERLEEALPVFELACSLEPSNEDYRQKLEELRRTK